MLLVQTFGPVIRSTLQSTSLGGVDLSREERLEKCSYCQSGFMKIQQRLSTLLQSTPHLSKIGPSMRELHKALRKYTE